MATTSVREHYETHSPQAWRRLVKSPFHRLEFDTTLHFLERHLPPSGLVPDVGGGPGRDTIELARRSGDVVLLDVTPALLEIARRQIARAELKRRVRAVLGSSIVDLSRFPAGRPGAVPCLGGPLSHVATEGERRLAVRELVRVARPGGRWASIVRDGSTATTRRSASSYDPVPAPTLTTEATSPSMAAASRVSGRRVVA